MSDVSFALKQVRDQIKAKLDERNAVQGRIDAAETEIDAIVARANSERRDINDAETALMRERSNDAKAIKEERDAVESDLAGLEERASLLQAHEESRAASKAVAAQWAGAAPEAGPGTRLSVKSEARTYGRAAEARGVSFFKDVFAATIYRDPEAGTRLERHRTEARLEELAGYEARDVATSAAAGLVVPQYLIDMAAPAAKAYRPTVEICNRHPLPDKGMVLNISRVTTQTATAAQATENSAVQETDIDDTTLAVDVRTYAGQQDLSRQVLERGSGVDALVIDDLTRDYWTKVDAAILNGAGTSGTHLGIRSVSGIVAVTYTDASATAAELYPKLADLISQVQAGVYMGVTHFIMAPRRWWWLAKEVGSTFPFLSIPSVSTNQAGNLGGTEYMAQNRNILGVPVVVDGNMVLNLGAGTNEDVILGVTAPELHFWDDGVQFIRAEQTTAGSLTTKFVLYGYSAFTAGRYPGAHGTIGGTGLITPTF